MKVYRLLIIVPALLLQVACGSNSSNNPSNPYYMTANGCTSSGGQIMPQSYCQQNGLTGAGPSQVCQGTYYYCPNGPQNCASMPNSMGTCYGSGAQDNCRQGNPYMYTQNMQPVTCL